jgi:hypothetical protein
LQCEITEINGDKFTLTLNDVKNAPNLCVNVFSLNKALKRVFEVSNDGVFFSLNYKHVRLIFDFVINATDGSVTGVLIAFKNINGFANPLISNERIYDTNHLLKLFGHFSQEKLNNTVEM